MEKSARKKTTKIVKNKKSTQLPTRRWAIWVVPIIIILFILGFVFSAIPGFKSNKVSGPQFRKEGELQFISAASGEELAKIEIEIADDDMTREQGLMWRRSMQEDQGMLFIMEMEEPQAFWMRNTYIPLDIIYLNANQEIVKIRANTQPQSLQNVTSERPALYVVEVNAGFAQRHKLQEGDRMEFSRLDQ